MSQSNQGYSLFDNGDCEKQPLPDGDLSDTTEMTVTTAPSAKWEWCHLVTAVLGYFCCQPFGTISLVMGMLAYTDHKARDFAGSQQKRQVALGFGVAAIVIGSIFALVGVGAIVFYVMNFQEHTDPPTTETVPRDWLS